MPDPEPSKTMTLVPFTILDFYSISGRGNVTLFFETANELLGFLL